MSRRLTTQEFIKNANARHMYKYDYTQTDYNSSKLEVTINCHHHGEFKQTPNNHLMGRGCPECGKKRKSTEEVIRQYTKIHGDKYDYSLVDYRHSKSKISIVCNHHGLFKQTHDIHLKGHGCPLCSESKGEAIITKHLTDNNIEFTRQQMFKDCKNRRTLPFDFYIQSINLLIEFDGRQHYEPIAHFGGNKTFVDITRNDEIKTKYALDNDINILRIPYWEINNIQEILIEVL